MWATPASRLAKEFGISDVMLGKLCRKFGFRAYPGYWSQIAASQRIQVRHFQGEAGLPTIILSIRRVVALYQPDIRGFSADCFGKATRESHLRGIHSEQAHSLVRQTRKVLEQRTSNGRSVVECSKGKIFSGIRQ